MFSAPRGWPLRHHLIALVVVALLPAVVFAAVAVALLGAQERRWAERALRDTARALASAVDREVNSSISTLAALATSSALEDGRLRDFHATAARSRSSQRGWDNVVLVTPVGEPLLNTAVPFGTALPALPSRAFVDEVGSRRQFAVSALNTDPITGHPSVSIAVPVRRKGVLAYVLAANFRMDTLNELIGEQRLPGDWTGTIIDSNLRIMARSRTPERFVGQPVTARLAEHLRREWEGSFSDTTKDGLASFGVFTRTRLGDWIVVLALPTATLTAGANRWLASVAVFGLLSIGLGVALAIATARRIDRPVAALARVAESFGAGRVPEQLPESTVAEVTRLGKTLREAARRREASEAALREQTAALEAANRTKDEFLATLSHELRTPLNAILGWASMLTKIRPDEATLARAMDVIARSGRAQLQLIEDLLDTSRITAGKLRLNVRAVNLATVIEEAVDTVQPSAAARSIELHQRLDHRPAVVAGDPQRLQQIVWNLLSNAVKFTPPGGRVDVTLRCDGDDAEIVVRDNGEGISPASLPLIFERFRQADSSSTRRHGGLGLGLALVKHLVDLHGGAIRADSAGTDQGATFTVRLPVLRMVGDHASRADGNPEARARGRLADLRILLVDDQPDTLDMFKRLLEGHGAVVRTATNAQEAFAAMETWRPEILVSDIEMPGEDGYSLLRRVRALPPERGGRVVAAAVTAYASMEHRLRALESGFEAYVAKPVEPDELVAVVASLALRVNDGC